MKDTVIIKVFRPAIQCAEYHDLFLDKFELKFNELKTFGKSCGKDIQFTVCPSLNCADFDCFTEITHNCEISIQEKEKYISIIKFFTQDANIDSGEMVVHDLPLKILFTKTHIDTL